LWVVLLGPDGAGKSAVISAIASGHSAGFAGCAIHHLRPSLLRGRREPATNCNPHGQKVRGTLLSWFKLAYLLLANWFGFLVAVRPQLARGKLILFDRYFPDSLVDPKRYRLPESCRRMSELVVKLLPQPDLYVVLDAPGSVLRERKCEVTLAESERQRRDYGRQFEMLPNVGLVDASRPLEDVVADVVDRIIEIHLARYRQSYQIA
jgi:thymidylate kinase